MMDTEKMDFTRWMEMWIGDHRPEPVTRAEEDEDDLDDLDIELVYVTAYLFMPGDKLENVDLGYDGTKFSKAHEMWPRPTITMIPAAVDAYTGLTTRWEVLLPTVMITGFEPLSLGSVGLYANRLTSIIEPDQGEQLLYENQSRLGERFLMLFEAAQAADRVEDTADRFASDVAAFIIREDGRPELWGWMAEFSVVPSENWHIKRKVEK